MIRAPWNYPTPTPPEDHGRIVAEAYAMADPDTGIIQTEYLKIMTEQNKASQRKERFKDTEYVKVTDVFWQDNWKKSTPLKSTIARLMKSLPLIRKDETGAEIAIRDTSDSAASASSAPTAAEETELEIYPTLIHHPSNRNNDGIQYIDIGPSDFDV